MSYAPDFTAQLRNTLFESRSLSISKALASPHFDEEALATYLTACLRSTTNAGSRSDLKVESHTTSTSRGNTAGGSVSVSVPVKTAKVGASLGASTTSTKAQIDSLEKRSGVTFEWRAHEGKYVPVSITVYKLKESKSEAKMKAVKYLKIRLGNDGGLYTQAAIKTEQTSKLTDKLMAPVFAQLAKQNETLNKHRLDIRKQKTRLRDLNMAISKVQERDIKLQLTHETSLCERKIDDLESKVRALANTDLLNMD